MQQLTIFDSLPAVREFKFSEPVKVVKATEDMDAETYFYLQGLQGKRGLIMKVIRQPSLQYEVDFNGEIAIVYHEELEGFE